MASSPEAPALWPLPELGRGADLGPSLASMCGADGAFALPELQTGTAEAAGVMLTEADEAHARGHAVGLAEGASLAEERIRLAVEAVRCLAEHLESARIGFEHDRERNLHGLALAVARKLIQREVMADPTLVRDLVLRALDLLPADNTLEVRLHPVDLAALGGQLGTTVPGSHAALQWVADPSLERGSFVVESPLRIVDGRSDVALRTLYERLDDE